MEKVDNEAAEHDSGPDFRRVLWRKIIVWVVVFFLVFWSVGRFYWWN